MAKQNFEKPFSGKHFIVRLSDSPFHTWKEGEMNTILDFNWEEYYGLDFSTNSYRDLIAIVSHKNKGFDLGRIKAIAYGIYQSSRFTNGDLIYGLEDSGYITKIGRVAENIDSIGSFRVKLDWLKTGITDFYWGQKIQFSYFEIYKIPRSSLENIPNNITEFFSNIDSNFKIDKVISDSIEIKFSTQVEFEKIDKEKGPGGKIKLFFGTNRNFNGYKDINEYFGPELGNELIYGICEVQIPRKHIKGKLERPKDFWVLELMEVADKHITLKSIDILKEEDFISTLKKGFSMYEKKSALLFIHGYNNSFADAARRTAQIAWDIPFEGLAGFFSWPSGGRMPNYNSDIEKADSSIPALEKFIEKIIVDTQVEQLHVIGHSMGNRVFTHSLNNLKDKTSLSHKISIIQQLILAAPDLDQDTFMNLIYPKFQHVGERRTLYASDKDSALSKSEMLRGDRPRLGDGGSSLLVINGVDSIDASSVKSSGNHHSYMFEVKELLIDLHNILNLGLPPRDRRLEERNKSGIPYWMFP